MLEQSPVEESSPGTWAVLASLEPWLPDEETNLQNALLALSPTPNINTQ